MSATERTIVTAIGDADAEDYLAQLMFSQGWNIVHRGMDADSLHNFFETSYGAGATLIYTRDFVGASDSFFTDLGEKHGLILISIDNIPVNAHSLMSVIRQQLRAPLIHYDDSSQPAAIQISTPVNSQTVVVTGTVGAPGRTTIAIALARKLSSAEDVELIDADTEAPACVEMLATYPEGRLLVTTINPTERLTTLTPSKAPRVVDMGAIGRIGRQSTDRRWPSELRTNLLEQSSTTIFVVPGSEIGLARLSHFLVDLPLLINKRNLIFLWNKAGSGRSDKAMMADFEKRTTGHPWARVSMDYALQSGQSSMGALVGRENRFAKEIAKIANLIKA